MIGGEIKRTDALKMTPSIRTALNDVQMDKVFVFYPDNKRYMLDKQVEA